MYTSLDETALKAEMTEHLGYEAHDPAPRSARGSSKLGSRRWHLNVTTRVGTKASPPAANVARLRHGFATHALLSPPRRGFISCSHRSGCPWACCEEIDRCPQPS